MAEETENLKQLEKIGDSLTKVEQIIEKNKKPILYVLIVIILLICGFFAYKNLYLGKQQDAALSAMWPAEAQFRTDSFHIALYGNENVTGFADIIDEYGQTKAGNVARFYAGCCAMRLGEFEAAIEYLENFSTKDPILESEAICLIGDAYSEMEDYKKAVSNYEEAAEVADNELLSPRCLLKAGLVYEKLGEFDNAVKTYTKVKTNYNGAPEAASIDKYITRAQLQKK